MWIISPPLGVSYTKTQHLQQRHELQCECERESVMPRSLSSRFRSSTPCLGKKSHAEQHNMSAAGIWHQRHGSCSAVMYGSMLDLKNHVENNLLCVEEAWWWGWWWLGGWGWGWYEYVQLKLQHGDLDKAHIDGTPILWLTAATLRKSFSSAHMAVVQTFTLLKTIAITLQTRNSV